MFWSWLAWVVLLAPVLEAATLLGRVVDAESGEPIPAASVVVQDAKTGTATDIEGRFTLRDLPPGTVAVEISAVGYEALRQKVFVGAAVHTLEFALLPKAYRGDEVVVTATRTPRYIKDVPIRTEVLTEKQIEDKAAINLYDALRGLPGVQVENRCQYCNFTTIRLQGLGPDHAQILIDGEPIYSGLASVYGLQQLGTADVERIEVVKGAGSALYGSGAISGAVNIITKKPSTQPQAQLELEYGSYGTYRLRHFASLRRGRVGLALTAQLHGGEAIDVSGEGENPEQVRKPDGYSDRVRTRTTNIGAKIVADSITGGDELTAAIKMVHELRQGGLLRDETFENPFTISTERIITDRLELRLSYSKDFGTLGKTNLSAAYVLHKRNATNDTYLADYMSSHGDTLHPIDELRPYLANENTFVVDCNHAFNLTRRHEILVGAQISYNKLDESGKYVINDTADTRYGSSYLSVSEKQASELGFYLQDQAHLTSGVELAGGARIDIHNSTDNFFGSGDVAPQEIPPVRYSQTTLTPRISLKVTPTSSLTLRATAGTGFRVPYGFSEDLHLCSGSPRVWKGTELKPERSFGANLSLDFDAEKTHISLNVFRTELRDMISFTGAGEYARNLGYTYEWKNIDDAYVQGIEANIIGRIWGNFIVSADFTLSDGKYKHPRSDWLGTEYESTSRYISRLPNATANIEAKLSALGWTAIVEANYVGAMYIDYFAQEETPVKIKRTEPYILLSATIGKRIGETLKLFIRVENITDYIQPERHIDDAAFIYAPLIGRLLRIGVEAKL